MSLNKFQRGSESVAITLTNFDAIGNQTCYWRLIGGSTVQLHYFFIATANTPSYTFSVNCKLPSKIKRVTTVPPEQICSAVVISQTDGGPVFHPEVFAFSNLADEIPILFRGQNQLVAGQTHIFRIDITLQVSYQFA
tara:strand:+ start:9008 stop:9418 length:411 start_codon:yes stop_codon:yes gene_type:complete